MAEAPSVNPSSAPTTDVLAPTGLLAVLALLILILTVIGAVHLNGMVRSAVCDVERPNQVQWLLQRDTPYRCAGSKAAGQSPTSTTRP